MSSGRGTLPPQVLGLRAALVRAAALLLPVFVLFEVNYPRLTPLADLAVFAALGLVLAFLGSRPPERWARALADFALALAALAVCGYVVVQTEPWAAAWWTGQGSLGARAGLESPLDLAVGVVGLALVLEATRRTIGWALPVLAVVFLLYARYGASMPDWLMPHRGYPVGRIVSQTFLHSQGVFGVALYVMFNYVFLFVVFGALLEASGATGYIVGAGRRLFGRTVGGPAKVAVFSSGLLGSLSGSAVANTATTGTFTIPMMRSAGFKPHLAAGVEAAASSGGALVPPVMGAGAYMMLELVDPPVTYLQVIRAALIPACLYYLSIFLLVHLHASRLRARGADRPDADEEPPPLLRYEGLLVAGGLLGLVALLAAGFTVFRAVSVAMAAIVFLAALHPRTRLGPARLLRAVAESSKNGVPLIGAAACVGVVIGVVTLTGAGTRLPSLILPLAQDHLMAALALIMVSSLVLGMGLPSVVCYLLLATLIGPVLGRLGVVPLAAHFFIFYFGLMSMVTPPVALAAYAASSIAGSSFFESSVAAFRFALVGFTLPFMFVFRPELLMVARDGGSAGAGFVTLATVLAVAGIVPLAAGLAGHLRGPLGWKGRALCFLSAALSLYPGGGIFFPAWRISLLNWAGIALLVALLAFGGRRSRA